MAAPAEEPHLIFLSHSGQDKDFVRRLEKALRAVGHDPFFDTRSIPPGEIFPPYILHHARECKLGVVVLSPGFLMSKWPMTELFTMYTSPSCPKILPLFLKAVPPDDLKPSLSRFSEWRNAWLPMAERDPARVSLTLWEAAVTELPKIHGVVYRRDMTEEDFIEEVVRSISTIIRPLLRYDVSHLAGHERLTQGIAELLEKVPRTSHLEARALGFHGVGGLGKTTACKLMVNLYARQYSGRCALIQLPSTGCSEKLIVEQCNAALERLIKTDQPNTLRNDDFDECLARIKKEGVSRRDVFIAIDNVWEDSLKFVLRILDLGFSRGSTILVTSRSKQVLLSLLNDESCVQPLPGLNEDEACQIFARSFHRNQAQGSSDVKLEAVDVQNVTKSFLFNDGYHPLAISAAGVSLGRSRGCHEWLAAWKSKPLSVTGCGSDTDKAIKINFDSIPRLRQGMLLNVALVYIRVLQAEARDDWVPFPHLYKTGSERFRQRYGFPALLLTWLSALYAGELDTHGVATTLEQLAHDGLLEVENEEVHVHDLYMELATREAVSHGFVLLHPSKDLQTSLCSSLYKGMIPAEVESFAVRVQPSQPTSSDNNQEVSPVGRFSFTEPFCELCFEAPKFSPESPKLRGIVGPGAHWFSEWNVVHMPELRVLQLSMKNLKFQRVGWGDMPKLSWLVLRISRKFADFVSFGISRKVISCLKNLRVLYLEADNDGCVRPGWFQGSDDQKLCLDGLVNLQFLSLISLGNLCEISGFNSLINLERMVLVDLPSLVKVGGFDSCSTYDKLQVLRIDACPKLTEVKGLSNLQFLKDLELTELIALPDLGASCMGALETLSLKFKEKANVAVCICNWNLPKLTRLEIYGGDRVEEIGGSLPRLKALHIFCFKDRVFDLGRLQNLGNLKLLNISGLKALEEIEWSCLNDLPKLQRINIQQCAVLERISGKPTGMNHSLHILWIYMCDRLMAISGLDFLANCRRIIQNSAGVSRHEF